MKVLQRALQRVRRYSSLFVPPKEQVFAPRDDVPGCLPPVNEYLPPPVFVVLLDCSSVLHSSKSNRR